MRSQTNRMKMKSDIYNKTSRLKIMLEWFRGSHISMTTDASSKSYNRFFPLHIFTFWTVSILLLGMLSCALVINYYDYLDSKIEAIKMETESISVVNSSFEEQFKTIDSIKDKLSDFELNDDVSH